MLHKRAGLLFAGKVEQDQGEDGAANRHEGEKPVGFAEGRQEQHQIDEVSIP